MPDTSVIVIGSGPAGANAAATLVAGGARVTMLDVGFRAPGILQQSPGRDFAEVRRNRADQHRWFLGEEYSSIPVDGLRGGLGGGMTSGNRGYVVRGVDTLLPLKLENAQIIQSLAQGGLGAAWGATSAFLPPTLLARMGLPPDAMERHYEIVTRRIGVSGPAGRSGVQPPLRLDHHGEALEAAARDREGALCRAGVSLRRPHAAVLTEPLGDRSPHAYGDLDFVADPERAVYRPHFTIEELQKHDAFRYESGVLVDRIEETANGVTVRGHRLEADVPGEGTECSARAVVLAAGAVNTARVLLRSLGWTARPLPLISKPHVFTACLHPRMLGVAGAAERTSLCQLMLCTRGESDDDGACAQLYSYRSLQLFRLLPALPLPLPEALKLLAALSPALIVADIRFPTRASNGSLALLTDGRTLGIRVGCTRESAAFQRRELRRLRRAMRAIGLLPLRTMPLPEGSASHYAGTVPSGPAEAAPLTAEESGIVRGFRSVSVADASLFRALPALPHTLTLMANASRIASSVLERL